MLSRRKFKIPKVSNLNGLGTRRISIQIKRLSETAGQSADTNDINSSLVEVEKWQFKIRDHLKKMNHLDVLEKSDRVFNMKEAYFSLKPTCQDSPFLTTLIAISASGIMAPTTVFSPNNELHPRNIIFASETMRICELPKHHLTNDKILTYMQFTFYPWLISKQTKFPVIIFIDIEPVHISWDTLTFCKENQIILLETTSALSVHPISSFVLPHLENAWNTELHEWSKKNENQQIALESAPSILGQVFEKTMTVDFLENGFTKCGTFPFDPVTVYKNRMAKSASPQTFDSMRQPERTVQSITQPAPMHLDQPTIEISQSMPEFPSQREVVSFDDEERTFTPDPEQLPQPAAQLPETSHTPQTPIEQPVITVPVQLPQPATQLTQTSHTSKPTTQLKVLLGPLMYEFVNAGSIWTGAIENTSLFDVWQRLLKSHQLLIHNTAQTAHPQEQEINQQFRIEFEGLIGPLLHDFRKSGTVWAGATENRALFEVWKHFINTLDK